MSGMTRWRIGLGPVFAYERIAASRRWQGYALRALFLLTMLVTLVVVWGKTSGHAGISPIRFYAQIASDIFIGVVVTQLALVLLVAPAATAGAICLDRARGTLAHMLLTDLSDAEVVLGTLAGRLLPVLGLLACALPVMELLTLLGGVDPAALLSAFVVTASVAVLGCALAMFLSLWMGKAHEALLTTYAILCGWILAWPILEVVTSYLGWRWLLPTQKINPTYMAFAPYWWPSAVAPGDYFLFAGAVCAIALLLTVVTTLRLRAVCCSARIERAKPVPKQVNRGNFWRFLHQGIPWLTPSLDGDPVSWREWHRGGGSRGKLVLTVAYASGSAVYSLAAVLWQGGDFAATVNGCQVAIGLLLLGIWNATSLAEERVRGSLDLLMCSPLSTWQIVKGKWIGAFRAAPLLSILPCVVIGSIAYTADRSVIKAVFFMLTYDLCAGAAVTSLGLLMAIWFSRVGRALSVTVAVYGSITVGWLFVVTTVFGGGDRDTLAVASPFFCAGKMTYDFGRRGDDTSTDWPIFWMAAALLLGVAMLRQAFGDFDRRLGRSEEPLVTLGRPSPAARIVGLVSIALSAFMAVVAIRWEWALVVAILLTFASIVVAGIAASSPVGDLARRAVRDLSGCRVSPMRIVFAKWKGAFRYALAFITIPSFIILARTGLDFSLWGTFVSTVGYMLTVCGAAASLGVATSVWLQRGLFASLIAMLVWVLPIIPWLAVATLAPGRDVGMGPYARIPAETIESLDRAFGSPGRVPLWMGLWSLVNLASTAVLLLAAGAKLERMALTKDNVFLSGRPSLRQLIAGNQR
jgi:ABC-type transport system involved in multi-copper enzyme maturation permease subunit